MNGRQRKTFVGCACAFTVLSAAAGARALEGTDTALVRLIQAGSSGFLDTVGSILSVPGRAEVSLAALAAVAAGLALRGRARLGRRLLVTLLATTVVELVLKFTLPQPPVPTDIQRIPDPSLYNFDTPYPYPSGHMLRAVIFLGAVFVLWPNPLVRFAILLLLVGAAVARVYLGTHWPSDVVGGALLGVAGLAWAFGVEDGGKLDAESRPTV